MSRSGYSESRSGYSDDLDPQELNCWRGAVESATRGKRGQALLREMLAALDAMPVKRLIADELVTEGGECCALGAVALARKVPGLENEDYDRENMAKMFDVAPALAAEIMFENDQDFSYREETPEQRFTHMRAWVAERIKGASHGG